MEKKIVGIFHTEDEAVQAIEALKRQGYTSDEISVIAKNHDDVNSISEETDTKATQGLAAGAATGGVLGGMTGLFAGLGLLAIPGVGPILAAGPIVATLTGVALGASTGGLVGGLIGLGISEDDAREYNDYVEQGKILVLVDSDPERDRSAYDSFRTNNSLISSSYGDSYGSDIDPNRLDKL